MKNLFAKLVDVRLHDVNVWLLMSKEDCHDNGTREWALKNACEEMAKIDDDLRTLKSVDGTELKEMLGVRVATEYEQAKKSLNDRLNN